MEPQGNIQPAPLAAPETPPQSKRANNPAQKWLIMSAIGFAICFGALGVHFLGGGSGSPDPLPKKVLSQVFGFTPYYFVKDTPPGRLSLDESSAKFFGNALTFTLLDSKQEKILVTQQVLPTTGYKKLEGETAKTPIGTATIKMGAGKVTAELITNDKTYITISASDFVSTGTLIDVFGNMTAAPKGIEAIKQ